MAVRNLLKRKMRTFLTVLSVVMGAMAIILMISLGIGINVQFESQMNDFGDMTLIELYNWDGYYGQRQGAPVFDDAAIAKMNAIKGVQVVTPVVNSYLRVVSGRNIADLQIYGVKAEALPLLGFKVSQGEMLKSTEGYNIVFGADAAASFRSNTGRNQGGSGRYSMYGYSGMVMYDSGPVREGGETPEVELRVDPLTDRFKASYESTYGDANTGGSEEVDQSKRKPDVYSLMVDGVMESGDKWESSYYSFMDIDDVVAIQKDERKYYDAIYGTRSTQETFGYERGIIKCTDFNQVESVLEAIKEMGFEAWSPMDNINQMKDFSSSLQMLLAIIGGISLFVAAIGIANTMIMAIYERTKEIGVMKVVGAAIKDIKKLFLLEAAIIGLVGGILGLGLSYIVSGLINEHGLAFLSMMFYNQDMATSSVIPVWLALFSLVFSAIIGVISGYFPARRATKVSALAAIRTE